MAPGTVFDEILIARDGPALEKSLKTIGAFPKSRFDQVLIEVCSEYLQHRFFMILGPVWERLEVSRTSLGWHWRQFLISLIFA